MAAKQDPRERLPLTHLTYHVLLALADADLHGYGIIKEVARRTDGQMELETGTLYAAIKRHLDDGLISVAPRAVSDQGDSRRRYYRLTPFGRRVLKAESERLEHLLEVAREKSVLGSTARA